MSKSFDVTKFGEDTLTQISNMKFTKAQQHILDCAMELDDCEFTDEEYYELAFYFAENNGLNV